MDMDIPNQQLGSADLSIARSRMYFLLAAGFSFPTESVHAQLTDGTYAEDVSTVLAVCAPELREAADIESLRTESSFEDFEAAYLSAFETNMPEPSVSLYEGSYVQKNNRPALLLEIKGFYHNFGLEMDASVNDLEDTLTAEFEFMQFLAAKEAAAEENGTDSSPYQRAQHDFMARHLAAWLPAFNNAVANQVRNGVFVSLAKLAADFVARDFNALKG
jgi:DMSO reductase family type II enzyme chaperone